MLSNRPLIVAPEATVATRLTSPDSEDVFVTLDGQTGFSLELGDQFIVTRADQRLNLVTAPGRTYFEVLRSKLKWGERYQSERPPC